MSSYLSGGGRTYALDLEIIKSPSHSTGTSHTSSSPSSTLSEASNSPLAISTRKARTPRKRPNQTYNEAAALLSTACPNIFSTKHLTNLNKFTTKPPDHRRHHQQQEPNQQFFDESSELLLPFRVIDDSGFLLHQPILDKPRFPLEPKVTKFCENKLSCQNSGEVDFQGANHNPMEVQISSEFDEDFDAESIILDEEFEEGIDSIMGNLSVKKDAIESDDGPGQVHNSNCWYGNPMGIGFGGKLELGFGMRSGMKALRQVDEGNWWNFPIDVLQISPKFNNSSGTGNSNRKGSSAKRKKKVEKEKQVAESKVSELPAKEESPIPKANSGELLLKLQYDDVLNAWSDKGSPFLDESLAPDGQGNDVSARLAQIDLFSDGGLREASVLRYKEKRRTRLFSKKIRYQVRKVNADRRPRMKGRFVRRPNSSAQDERGKKKVVMLSDL